MPELALSKQDIISCDCGQEQQCRDKNAVKKSEDLIKFRNYAFVQSHKWTSCWFYRLFIKPKVKDH